MSLKVSPLDKSELQHLRSLQELLRTTFKGASFENCAEPEMSNALAKAIRLIEEKAVTNDLIEQEAESVDLMPAETRSVTPMQLIDRALLSGADPAALERLMDLQERWEKNEARKAFDAAMAAARADLPKVIKEEKASFPSKNGGRVDYHYEDLGGLVEQISPILTQHDLSFRWSTDNSGDKIVVTCKVAHKDGYFETTALAAPPDTSGSKNSIQALGSTITYLQRYTLKAALGVAASTDLDGAADPRAAESPWLAKIAKAEDMVDLGMLGDHIKADSTLTPEQVRAARAAWSDRKKVLEAALAEKTEDAEQADD